MLMSLRTKLILAGLLIAALLACGMIGYANLSDWAPGSTPRAGVEAPTRAGSPLKLQYCADAEVDLCISSFGRDSAQNSLIVIKNSNPAFSEMYLRIKRANFWRIYPCQRVELLENTYYCAGDYIPDGEKVTVNVYSKNNNRLIARAVLPFAAGIASLAEITVIPPTETPVPELTSGTPGEKPTLRPAARNTNVPGQPTATRIPSYPYPTSYP
jgi:hypothetical protein